MTESAMEADIEAQVAAAAFVDGTAPAAVPTGSNGSHTPSNSSGGNGSAVAGSAPREPAPMRAREVAAVAATSGGLSDVQTGSVQAMLADQMGDAPLCDTCGHITVRNGSCYRCLNCGDSKGCS